MSTRCGRCCSSILFGPGIVSDSPCARIGVQHRKSPADTANVLFRPVLDLLGRSRQSGGRGASACKVLEPPRAARRVVQDHRRPSFLVEVSRACRTMHPTNSDSTDAIYLSIAHIFPACKKARRGRHHFWRRPGYCKVPPCPPFCAGNDKLLPRRTTGKRSVWSSTCVLNALAGLICASAKNVSSCCPFPSAAQPRIQSCERRPGLWRRCVVTRSCSHASWRSRNAGLLCLVFNGGLPRQGNWQLGREGF